MALEGPGAGLSFQNLPKEIQAEVSSFLGAEDVATLSLVSKVFNRVINDPAIWTRVAKKLNVEITNSKNPKQDVLAHYKEQNDALLQQWSKIGKFYSDKKKQSVFLSSINVTPDIFLQRRMIEEKIASLNLKERRELFVSGGTDGNVTLIKFFIDFYPPSLQDKQRALYNAIAYGRMDVVQFFLAHNVSLFLKNEKIAEVIALAQALGHLDVAKLAQKGVIQAAKVI